MSESNDNKKPIIDASSKKFSKDQIIGKLWEKGLIDYKLDSMQKDMVSTYQKIPSKVQVWLQSRRCGKSFTLVNLALKECLSSSNRIVKFCAPTRQMVETIIRPLIRDITMDCPEHLKPEYNAKSYTYKFKNGSEIQLAGTDLGHADRLRGGSSHLCLVDEAAMCTDLSYVIKSVLLPTTLTTRGKIILASTPPKDSEHDFNDFVEQAELDNCLLVRTIYDNPRITKEDIEDIIKSCGGVNSPDFKREFLCKRSKDPSSMVIPEFDDELKAEIIKEVKAPEFFDYYTSIDIGFKDLTAALFAYYDYVNDIIVIEDELVVDYQSQEMHLDKLSGLIKEKENKISNLVLSSKGKPPLARVCDSSPVILQEFYKYGLYFNVLKKKDKAESLNYLRMLLNAKKILINPRCKHLVRHLDNVKWRTSNDKSKFGRSADNGHYDCVDALLYLIKNIDFNKNPYPTGYNLNNLNKDIHVNNYSRSGFSKNEQDIYKAIFNIKR